MSHEPLNLEAVRTWVEKNRPDLTLWFNGLVQHDSCILLMTMGFEAGRQFQVDNPKIPLNEPMYYANFG